jgi:putative glycerol-1-phosphate prenyltransferase
VDALLFLSLVTGRNPQYLIEEHVRAVPFIERNPQVEVISTAYCLIDGGVVTTVESVSQTRPLPADKPELVAVHVRAAALIGMRATYLDAGSGARKAVSPRAIAAARGATEGPLFVGGGIRTPEDVRLARDAGADFVVVGTLLEEQGPRLVSGLAHAARA